MRNLILALLFSSSAFAGVEVNKQPFDISNMSLVSSISTNQLVVNVKTKAGAAPTTGNPVNVAFKNATGGFTAVAITAATSITLAAADSIGTIVSEAFPLWVYLINDTTPEICLSRSHFNEGTAQNASALTGGADTSATTLWCTSAHTSKSVRKVGKILSVWSNPNWATPSETDLMPLDNGCLHLNAQPDVCTLFVSGPSCTTGTCTLTDSTGDVTVVFSATGNYTGTFSAGAFSVAPSCTISTEDHHGYWNSVPTRTGFGTQILNGSNTPINGAWDIVCIGHR